MKRRAITKLLFLLILLCVLMMIFPLCLAIVLSEKKMILGFGLTIALTAAVSFPVLAATRKTAVRFTASQGFMLVFFAWLGACLTGSLPYFISGYIPHFVDAVFESVSGFTTTGVSVLSDLDIMPRSLIFWRAETQWLGGMGMIVLTVALLPFLGVGGFQLLKAEAPGPDKERITAKITETAKILWLMYIILTALETVLLVLAGMSCFDAIVHSFSTMATGGFSSRNEGLAYWNSPVIVWIAAIFMFIAACNFTLLFRIFRGKWKEVYYNSEARAYLVIIFVSTVICSVSLFLSGTSGGKESLRTGFFYTLSVLSTTGFTAGSENLLPPLAKAALFVLMFIGGCSLSTAGGIKVIRHVVLWKQTGNELKKILYPRGVFSIRLNNKAGRKDVVYGVAGFIFLYLALLCAAALVVAGSGTDHFSAFSAALITLGNIGLDPGIGRPDVFTHFPAYVKWVLSFVMIAGRLELWTAFVLFTRDYWR